MSNELPDLKEPVSAQPFTLTINYILEDKPGHFKPEATVRINRSLRSSGFLLHCPADDLKTFLCMLTFAHPNGHCQVSVPEFAAAMYLSAARTRKRLERLAKVSWQDQPVIQAITRQSGLTVYSPSPLLLETVSLPMPTPEMAPMPVMTAGRDAVINRSRERYTKPRLEVEAQIAEHMGWDQPGIDEAPEEKHLHQVKTKLQLCGVSRTEAEQILARFPLTRIEQQIAWLPYRHANAPARYLVAAIERNYGIPTVLAKQQKDAVTSLGLASADMPAQAPSENGLDMPKPECVTE
jgi:hypothetical protein